MGGKMVEGWPVWGFNQSAPGPSAATRHPLTRTVTACPRVHFRRSLPWCTSDPVCVCGHPNGAGSWGVPRFSLLEGD